MNEIRRVVNSIVNGMIRLVAGESASQRINRKQNELSAQITSTHQDIEVTTDREIDVIRAVAQTSFGRLEDLLAAAGNFSAGKRNALITAKAQITKALEVLDAQLV